MAAITTIFSVAVAIAPIHRLIIATRARRRMSARDIWAAALPLDTTGLTVAVASHAFL